MQVLYDRSCGLDVHKKTVVACVLITSADGQVHKQVRTVDDYRWAVGLR